MRAHGPGWEKTGPGAESHRRDKGPRMGVGFRNGRKDDMAMGRITARYF